MDAPKIEFPCEYPIKIVARAGVGLRARLDEIVFRHAGALEPGRISERGSAQQNFTSVTYLIEAKGEAQLAALFAELKACSSVMVVL